MTKNVSTKLSNIAVLLLLLLFEEDEMGIACSTDGGEEECI
jgi:hypothetical protein